MTVLGQRALWAPTDWLRLVSSGLFGEDDRSLDDAQRAVFSEGGDLRHFTRPHRPSHVPQAILLPRGENELLAGRQRDVHGAAELLGSLIGGAGRQSHDHHQDDSTDQRTDNLHSIRTSNLYYTLFI